MDGRPRLGEWIKHLSNCVVRAKYTNARARPFNYEAIENITVVEHTKCKCKCKIQESDCNSLQIYKPNECMCECSNQAEVANCRGADKFWDSKKMGPGTDYQNFCGNTLVAVFDSLEMFAAVTN
ncbi:hypothetical protein GQR58_012894 [Nymphon striatum]|nr:hypothetical protein GQR58_012894 [Nymphon striatum]